jgi:tetratricopeptide (TPR) repeat protein
MDIASQLGNLLVATLAVAKEPLSADGLAALLVRRRILPGAEGSPATLERYLSSIGSRIEPAPRPDGGDGYTLVQDFLREYLRSPANRKAIASARKAMAEAGLRPAGDAAGTYLYRQGISHLLDQGRRDEALGLMMNSEYVVGRLEALPKSQGASGLAGDWCTWLIPSQNAEELEAAAQIFCRQFESAADDALSSGALPSLQRLKELLLWGAVPLLEVRPGGVPGLRVTCAQLVDLAQRLVALEPRNTTFLSDLSASFDKIGNLDSRTDLAKARDWYLKSLEIRQRLAALEPENKAFLFGLSIAFYRIGALDAEMDRGKAREWYLKSLEVDQRLVVLEPENTTFLGALSESFGEIGDLDAEMGATTARDWYFKSLEIRQRLATQEPGNTVFLSNLSVAIRRIGELDARTSPVKARKRYLKSLEIAQRLEALEPGNAAFLWELAILLSRLIELDAREDPEKAHEWRTKGIETARRLIVIHDGTDEKRLLSRFLDDKGLQTPP